MSKAVPLIAATVVSLFLTFASHASAGDASQTVTSHGLAVYFGFVPAAIAQGVAGTHGDAEMHGPDALAPSSYHLLVAIFNSATGDRISDATVAAVVTRAGGGSQTKPLEPMKIADTVTYGNFFDLPPGGLYHVTLNVTKKGDTRPTQIDFAYDQHFHQ